MSDGFGTLSGPTPLMEYFPMLVPVLFRINGKNKSASWMRWTFKSVPFPVQLQPLGIVPSVVSQMLLKEYAPLDGVTPLVTLAGSGCEILERIIKRGLTGEIIYPNASV